MEEHRKEQTNEWTNACAFTHLQIKEQTCACKTNQKLCDHKGYICWLQLTMIKAPMPRHCIHCCLPCRTATWQSRGQLWAGPSTALLLTSGPTLQPWGQLVGYPVTALPMIVDPLLQPWGCPVDPTPAILWPKANISLGLVVNVS